MSNKIVIGLGFGDEGKGNTVDYLCSLNPSSVVVRFSGGHQVGHTVVHGGIRHVFSNFGSGTLNGNKTFWSKFCTVDPVGFYKEANILSSLGVRPNITVDLDCPITTPYDKLANQVRDGELKHGTCGVGFGTTIQRQKDFYSLTCIDLLSDNILKHRLENIRKYYSMKYPNFVLENTFLDEFFEACKFLQTSELVTFTGAFIQENRQDMIFEGSQGLLLDQHFGFFPNVTYSNLGIKNICKLIGKRKTLGSHLFLVTRAYQTRHGNGFMTNEEFPHHIKLDENETNVSNKYQGDFRRTILDLDLLKYAIAQKEIYLHPRKSLVITCLDHLGKFQLTDEGTLKEFPSEKDFIEYIRVSLGIFDDIYVSRGPNGIENSLQIANSF